MNEGMQDLKQNQVQWFKVDNEQREAGTTFRKVVLGSMWPWSPGPSIWLPVAVDQTFKGPWSSRIFFSIDSTQAQLTRLSLAVPYQTKSCRTWWRWEKTEFQRGDVGYRNPGKFGRWRTFQKDFRNGGRSGQSLKASAQLLGDTVKTRKDGTALGPFPATTEEVYQFSYREIKSDLPINAQALPKVKSTQCSSDAHMGTNGVFWSHGCRNSTTYIVPLWCDTH